MLTMSKGAKCFYFCFNEGVIGTRSNSKGKEKLISRLSLRALQSLKIATVR